MCITGAVSSRNVGVFPCGGRSTLEVRVEICAVLMEERTMRLRLSVMKGVLGGFLGLMGAFNGARALAAGPHPLRVENGVLTVDGLTVKTGLDLRVLNLHFLYVGLPGVGTALVAERPFVGAMEERGAFRGNSLTVMAGGSRLQLTSTSRLRGTRSAYVRFDRGAGPERPEVRFGDAAMVPAVWSAALPEEHFAPRRVRMHGTRALRTAKLCRPSRKGGEKCAVIREVVYKPTGRD